MLQIAGRDKQGSLTWLCADHCGQERGVTGSFPFPMLLTPARCSSKLRHGPSGSRAIVRLCYLEITQWRATRGRCDTAPFLKSGNLAFCLSFI